MNRRLRSKAVVGMLFASLVIAVLAFGVVARSEGSRSGERGRNGGLDDELDLDEDRGNDLDDDFDEDFDEDRGNDLDEDFDEDRDNDFDEDFDDEIMELGHRMHHSTPVFDFQVEDMHRRHHSSMSTFDFETHRSSNEVRFDFERRGGTENRQERRHMHHM